MNILVVSGTYSEKDIQPATVICDVMCGFGRHEKSTRGRIHITGTSLFNGKLSPVYIGSEMGKIIADMNNLDLDVYVEFIHNKEDGTIQECVRAVFGENVELFDEVVVVTDLRDSVLGGER